MEKVLNVTLCGFYLLQLRGIYCTKRFIEFSWKGNNVVDFGLGQFQPKMLGKMAKNVWMWCSYLSLFLQMTDSDTPLAA